MKRGPSAAPAHAGAHGAESRRPIGSGGAAAARAGAPTFLTAVRGELSLLRLRPVVWVALGIWAACIVLFAYLVGYLTTVGSAWFTPEQQATFVRSMLPQGTTYHALTSLPLYGAPQFAILGAILGTLDYGSGTVRTVVARFTSRDPYMAARLAALLLIALAAAVATMLASVISSLGVALVSGNPVAFPPLLALATTLGAAWLVAAAFIAVGFALGTLTRRTVIAVVLAALWVLGVESLLVGMLAPVVPFLGAVQGYLPVGATTSLAAAFVPAGQQTALAMTAVTGPGVAVVVLLLFTAAAALAAFLSFRRRDLA